jgi:hypothetical protein
MMFLLSYSALFLLVMHCDLAFLLVMLFFCWLCTTSSLCIIVLLLLFLHCCTTFLAMPLLFFSCCPCYSSHIATPLMLVLHLHVPIGPTLDVFLCASTATFLALLLLLFPWMIWYFPYPSCHVKVGVLTLSEHPR